MTPIIQAMSRVELQQAVEEARRAWQTAEASVEDEASLEALRIRFLGKKGVVTALMTRLRDLSPEERAEAGRMLNALKTEVTEGLEARRAALMETASRDREAKERYDFTLPGTWRPIGRLHPLTRVRLEIEDIFQRLGFVVATGPEAESDYYNFEALNMPADHPARDEWDSFYLGEGRLLRTHTSPVQIRVMRSQQPPVRIICPGKCYRRDNPDATHSPVFYQVELLWVEQGLTLANLKWVISEFVSSFFGPEYEMRFAADYFPFTEPSAQVHIRKVGREAPARHLGGWLEIMGAGMVDPAVLAGVGYDPEEVTGFAFGLGVERMAMLRWGIEDIRSFYENHPRFLAQF